MFHNQKLNNHINCTRERELRMVYQDHNSRFDERHDHNLQKLLIEIFKVKMTLTPEITNEVFDNV